MSGARIQIAAGCRRLCSYGIVSIITYQDHTGSSDQIQIEINFLMRACALAPQLRQATPIGDEAACEFPLLAIEELFAGKIRAMIDRQHPRGPQHPARRLPASDR